MLKSVLHTILSDLEYLLNFVFFPKLSLPMLQTDLEPEGVSGLVESSYTLPWTHFEIRVMKILSDHGFAFFLLEWFLFLSRYFSQTIPSER